MLEYENYKKNKFIEKNSYKLGEKMNKPQTKKLDRIEKSLTDNIAMIESIFEGLKSDFNYIKNMTDCSVEKEKGIKFAVIDIKDSLPSFVEVVRRLEKLEEHVKSIDEKLSFVTRKIVDENENVYNHLRDIDRRLKKLENK